MDPINNPTPTPNPVQAPVPNGPVPPVPDSSSVEPAIPPVAPVAPATPSATPVSPVPPVAPVDLSSPLTSATEPVAPVTPPVAPVSPAPAPITINPGQSAVNPAINSMFVPGNGGLVGETDPITMPTPPKAPDPVEEELKAPFKAAGPVPGSIGSAISMPADAAMPTSDPGRVQSVSFNDPAMTNNSNPVMPVANKKAVSKSTLITLAAVMGVVVVGLAIYLIMTLLQGK